MKESGSTDYESETRKHADEFRREPPSEEALTDAHDAVVKKWEDEHPGWLEDVRPRLLNNPEYWPSEFRNEAERRFVSHKQAQLEVGRDAP